MRYFITLLLLLAIVPLTAQTTVQETLDWQKATLDQRYHWMKSKAQTFQDYKVIKEYVLEGMWKTVQDTMRGNKQRLNEAKGAIASLEDQLKSTRLAIAEKEASMEEIVYASNHISIAGISFPKGVFVTMVAVIALFLLLTLGFLTGKMKLMYSSIKEKIELINATTFEFEDYKRKSLDRQTKLSRELQNERNKLMELRRG